MAHGRWLVAVCALAMAASLRAAELPDDYRRLLEEDAQLTRPVDAEWAAKLEALLGGRFRLYHTAHFTILSDAPETVSRSLGAEMEKTYRAFYTELPRLGLRPQPPAGRLVAFLFNRHDDYRDFLDRFEGITTHWAAGLYSWRTNRSIFYHDRDNPAFQEVREEIGRIEQRITTLRQQLSLVPAADRARRAAIEAQIRGQMARQAEINARLAAAAGAATLGKARHEVAHQLLFNSGMFRRGRDYPFWLNEGLAMLLESNQSKRFANTHRLKSYRAAEKDRALLPLDKLISEMPGEEEEQTRVAERYAQAWALTRYLWETRPDDLRKYIELVMAERGNTDNPSRFRRCFGSDSKTLEESFRLWMERLAE